MTSGAAEFNQNSQDVIPNHLNTPPLGRARLHHIENALRRHDPKDLHLDHVFSLVLRYGASGEQLSHLIRGEAQRIAAVLTEMARSGDEPMARYMADLHGARSLTEIETALLGEARHARSLRSLEHNAVIKLSVAPDYICENVCAFKQHCTMFDASMFGLDRNTIEGESLARGYLVERAWQTLAQGDEPDWYVGYEQMHLRDQSGRLQAYDTPYMLLTAERLSAMIALAD